MAFLAPFVNSAAASAGGCIFWLAENYQGMQAQYVDLQKRWASSRSSMRQRV